MGNDNVKGRSLNSDEERMRLKAWQVKKLRPIKDHLSREWSVRYEQLVSEVGEQEARPAITFGPGYAFYEPDISPINKEQLGSMAPKDAVRYVATWRPNSSGGGESAEGLSQVWAEVIAENVVEYSRHAGQLLKEILLPLYVYYFLRGISSGLKKSGGFPDFDWGSLITLGKMISTHYSYSSLEADTSEDNYQSSIKRELLDIIEKGLRGPDFAMPYDVKETVWRIIEVFIKDPEPDVAYEIEYGPPNMEATVMSINTVRGKAFHCVFHYAVWIDYYQNKERTDQLKEHSLPSDVKNALSRILEFEKTKTVWSVIGWHLNIIVHLDAAWLSDNISKVIPSDPRREEYRYAVFEGYFSFSRPYGQFLRRFKEILEAALDWSLERPEDRDFYHPREKFVQHLIVYYWWGLERIENTDSLISQFFAKAPVEMRAKAIQFVGRLLENITPDEPGAAEVYAKLEKLYDWRMQVAGDSGKANEFAIELKEFGWWVVNGHLNSRWLMMRLLETLKITGGELEWKEAVLDKLPVYASEHCKLVAEIIKYIIQGDKTGYNLRYWVPRLRKIIERILSCDSPKARAIAREAINKLADKEGITDLRDLL